MAKTQHYGLNKFGAEGRLSDEGYKFSLRDRDLLDSLIFTMMNHDHRAISVSVLESPPAGVFLDVVLDTTTGVLPAGRDFYYKFSYVDSQGNETAASSAILSSSPDPFFPPESQTLTTAATGGTLLGGTYKYALGFYQDAGGTTDAPNLSTIVVSTATTTNTVTIPLPTSPDDADGWKIYRKAPGELEYFLLKTQADGPSQYVDDGTDSPDCTIKRPQANSTNATNSFVLDLPATELPLDSRVVSWRIYRTNNAGSYTANSLVSTVVETTTEGGSDLVTTYTDEGDALNLGIPLGQTAVPLPPPTLDAGDIFDPAGDPMPAALAPLGVRAFNLLLPSTLTARSYHEFVPPHDMNAERMDGYYLTSPTGMTPTTDFLTVRFSDDDTQNEFQSLFNEAIEEDEVQTVFNNATAGTFTLTDTVDTTSAIAFDALSSVIKTRLEADITAITTVNVSGSGTANDPWTIIYTDPGSTDVTELQAGDGGLTGGSSTVATTGEGSDGGTFTLSDGTDTTSNMAYNISAATLETRLETDITAYVAVTVTGAGTRADPWVVEFVNPGSQNVDIMIVDSALLNGLSFIEETIRGYPITQVDMIVDQNQADHFWQSSTTDFATQEAEELPALGDGTTVSDTLALNDSATELDAQGEKSFWQIGALEIGEYSFFYWVADSDMLSTFTVRLNDLTVETQSLHNTSTTGDFQIIFGSQTTAAIPYNESAANLKIALELLSNIITVSVTGIGTAGDPWKIDFDNPAGNVDEITTDDAGMDQSSVIATDVAGTSTELEALPVATNRPVYTPAYELNHIVDGTETLQMEVEKTNAPTNNVRVDKFEYEVVLPVLHGGSNVKCEVLVTGTPSTNGDDLQLTLWY